ncbi:peptidylprolyl isomerase [Microterricola viridarii]|uniref:peptidylprolyl isomerase n=1 Tax=Microterricola viridarii TaxID=412690 RepID=A0A1H1U0E7_9MICO|nr:peptidylprolyl isomerase [Microterricola viridarii]SDS65369.1 peptidyl-prolyl cis-trans isomerase B (cyclophilin B) [Microterricola viridarii]
MASNPKQDREARARLRAYQARQAVHERRTTRRARDNWIAAIALVVILVLAVGAQLLFFNGGPGTAVPTPTDSATPAPTDTPEAGTNIGDVPPASLAEGRTWTGTLTLNDVELGIELDGAAAPQAVASTISLAEGGFYNGVSCHRLTDGGFYVLQCGDPSGDGTGGPGYSYGPIENAPADNVYPEGTIAMARSTGNGYSMGSQFFIVYGDTTIGSDAAGGYTVLGRVTSGLDQLKEQITDAGVKGGLSDGAPAVPTTITGFTLQ